jgi:hypothetical protein
VILGHFNSGNHNNDPRDGAKAYGIIILAFGVVLTLLRAFIFMMYCVVNIIIVTSVMSFFFVIVHAVFILVKKGPYVQVVLIVLHVVGVIVFFISVGLPSTFLHPINHFVTLVASCVVFPLIVHFIHTINTIISGVNAVRFPRTSHHSAVIIGSCIDDFAFAIVSCIGHFTITTNSASSTIVIDSRQHTET